MGSDRAVLQRFVLGLRKSKGALYVAALKPGERFPLVHGLASPEKLDELRRAIADYFGAEVESGSHRASSSDARGQGTARRD